MAKQGRQFKFDERRAKIILKNLADGQTRDCSSSLAGICPRTFRYWMRRQEPMFISFVADVKKAERQAEAEAVKHIRRQGKNLWTAYAWWLERKMPESWAKDNDIIRDLLKRIEKLEAKRG